MFEMFAGAAYNASNWSLNLSGWNVDKVTVYDGFNSGVESKLTAPIWVN